MNKLNSAQLAARNLWFKYVFFPLIKRGVNFTDISERNGGHGLSVYLAAADKIKEVITENKFTGTDDALSILSDIVSIAGQSIEAEPETIANYVASFCQEKEIWFDDFTAPKYTPHEIEYFKNTILGKALVDFGCFVSQDPALQTQQPQQTQRAASQKSGGSANERPKIDNCYGLIDKQRTPLYGNIYWIGGDFINTHATKARVHVKPLSRPTNGNNLTVFTDGSGQGWGDMVLFWDNSRTATDVANKIDQTKHSAKVQSYGVKRQTAKGDFYRVSTEFGEAYIKADRLVEMVEDYQKRFTEELSEFFKSLD